MFLLNISCMSSFDRINTFDIGGTDEEELFGEAEGLKGDRKFACFC